MNRNRTIRWVLFCLLIAGAASSTAAQSPDGVWLTVDSFRATTIGTRLSWSGGAPYYEILRSASPTLVGTPAAWQGTTLDHEWFDPGNSDDLTFYLVRSRSSCWEATADAYVRSDFPNDNLGNEDTFEVREGTPDELAFVQFPIPDSLPRNATILSAELVLQQVGGDPGTWVAIDRVAAPWTEDGVTFASRPSTNARYGTNYNGSATGRRTWDVTGLVQEWIDGGAPALGIRVTPDDEADFAVFSAREDVAPQLCVSWESGLESARSRLQSASTVTPHLEVERGIATSVVARVAVPRFSATSAALWFLDRYKELYGLQDPTAELWLDRLVTDELGRTKVVFGTRRDGIRYRGQKLAVEVGPGAFPNPFVVYGTSASLRPDPSSGGPPFSARMTPTQARQTAEELFGATTTIPLGEPYLQWFDPNLEVEQSAAVRPTWRVALEAQEPGGGWQTWVIHVDAEYGSIVRQDLQERTAGDRAGENFVVRTAQNTTHPRCWRKTNVDQKWFTEAGPTGNYPGATSPQDPFGDGQNDWDGTHLGYHEFIDRFERQGQNGKGGKLKSLVHVANPNTGAADWNNAAYSPFCNHMIYGDGWAVDDIIVHEFTHGIVRWTAELAYENESGALDESFADFFAALADGNWTMGEDREAGGRGISRSLSDPPSSGSDCGGNADPDHILAANSGDLVGLRPAVSNPQPSGAGCSGNDSGWVHTNSGIPNKVAYLLTVGGIHNGLTVGGLDEAKVARLYFSVLTKELHESSSFAQAQTEFVLKAQDYQMGGHHNFDLNDVCDVINAWASVGYGDPDFNCDGQPDAPSGDGDWDGVPDGRDNCVAIPNADQTDLDGDLAGDLCDPDVDNDGLRNDQDNCIRTANPGQVDADSDGVGDLCDDADMDGVLEALDNCPAVANSDQADRDGDTLGDACDDDDDNDGVLDASDNCVLDHNPSQTNSDADSHGNACDNCLLDANEDQLNTDNDSQGDICDDDDDNDEVLDGLDNCPTYANPRQIDNDLNGMGMWCDVGELALLVGFAEDVELAIAFQDDNPLEPIRFEIFPCAKGISCPNVLPEVFRVDVAIQMSPAYEVRIVDDRGWEMADAEFDPSGAYSLSFDTDAEYYYDDTVTGQSFHGRRYFLEMLAPVGASPAAVTGTIDVDTSDLTP